RRFAGRALRRFGCVRSRPTAASGCAALRVFGGGGRKGRQHPALPPFCPSALSPFRLSAFLPFCLSAFLPFRLSAFPPFCLSAFLPFRLSAFLPLPSPILGACHDAAEPRRTRSEDWTLRPSMLLIPNPRAPTRAPFPRRGS